MKRRRRDIFRGELMNYVKINKQRVEDCRSCLNDVVDLAFENVLHLNRRIFLTAFNFLN